LHGGGGFKELEYSGRGKHIVGKLRFLRGFLWWGLGGGASPQKWLVTTKQPSSEGRVSSIGRKKKGGPWEEDWYWKNATIRDGHGRLLKK